MPSANATELYIEMVHEIKQCPSIRTVTDPSSPCKDEIIEAPPGKTFTLRSTDHNLVGCVPVNIARAKALVLHLFANTELATPMAKIPDFISSLTKISNRYYWRGAYGPIVMPQIAKCIALLRTHQDTRRAVLSFLDKRPHDINRPACISFLQFLKYRERLHLVATQRALRLCHVPYDCILLTEILRYVCRNTGIPAGELHWHIGTLHAKNVENWDAYSSACTRNDSVRIETETPWEDLCTLLK